MRKSLLLFFTLACAGFSVHAGCYTVLSPKGQVLSQSPNPPVDMSYQLHQTVPYKYGKGSVLVFGVADEDCGEQVDAYYDAKSIVQAVHRSKTRAHKTIKQRRYHSK